MNFKDLNWNKMWMEAIEKSSLRQRRGDMIEYWNTIARRYNELVQQDDRAKAIISKLEIDPSYTILDIGAGPGTLTIPLARIVKHVTVIEPSSGMLACLKENAANEGLKNITCINKKWEEVLPDVDISKHDVVIASYSLSMIDIKAALLQMNELARHCIYLFDSAGGHMCGYNELWPKLYSEDFQSRPDYIYLYNILYEIGIYANVNIFITESKEFFSSFNEAIEQWMEKFDVSTQEAKEVIRSFLSDNLVQKDGGFCSKYKMKSAMVWWKK